MLQKIVTVVLASIVFSAVSVQAQVVATVGNKKITLQDFKKKYEDVKAQSINPPTPEVFLEDLIRFEVGVQEAEKRKLEKDPIVQERFRQELYKALVEKEIGADVQKINVTEEEMRRYYARNPELKSSHILIEFKPTATPKEKEMARQRANDIYKEVRASKRPFEELVKLYTDDTLSKTTGGDIGYQSRVTLVPEYYDTLSKMKVNEIRGLVETPYGFHIVKLTGKRSYQQANKRQLRAAVFDEKRKDIFDKLFQKLKSKYKISMDKKLVSSVK